MYKFRNSLIAFAGLAALAGAIAIVRPGTGQGQGARNEKDKDVRVVNTTDNPVPAVVQTSAQQPLYMLPAAPHDSIFHRTATIVLEDGHSFTTETPPGFVVPPGKTLHLQYVSADIVMFPNRELAEIPDVRLHLLNFGTQDVDAHFTEVLKGASEWSIGQQLYGFPFESGTTLPIHFSRTSSSAGTSTLVITLSGTLIPE
jgi:hypothetical protein